MPWPADAAGVQQHLTRHTPYTHQTTHHTATRLMDTPGASCTPAPALVSQSAAAHPAAMLLAGHLLTHPRAFPRPFLPGESRCPASGRTRSPGSMRSYMLFPQPVCPRLQSRIFPERCDVRPAVSSCRQHTSRAGPAFSDPAHVFLSPGTQNLHPAAVSPGLTSACADRLCTLTCATAALHCELRRQAWRHDLTTDLRTGPQTNPEGSCCSSQTVPANRYVSQTSLVCSYVTSSLHR